MPSTPLVTFAPVAPPPPPFTATLKPTSAPKKSFATSLFPSPLVALAAPLLLGAVTGPRNGMLAATAVSAALLMASSASAERAVTHRFQV